MQDNGVGCGCDCGAGSGVLLFRRRLLLLLIAGGAWTAAGCGLAAQVAAFTTPEHWCRDAYADALQEQLPLTPLQVRQFTVPARRGPAGFVYSQCHRFQGDTVVAYLQWVKRKKPPFSNSSNPEILCDQGWHYNFTTGFHSVSTEMNWVCSDKWKTFIVHVLFFLCATLGLFFFSFVNRRCNAARALLLASVAGAAGASASLQPPRSFAHVASVRAAAALAQLAGPLLALRLLTTDVWDQSDSFWTAASDRGRITAVALVIQSASAVAASGVALFVPAWWLSVATAVVFTLVALLLCWQILISSKCIAGSSKTLQLPRRVMLDVQQLSPLDSVIHSATQVAGGAAYFGLWLWAPRLVSGSPARSAALLAAAECVAWPVLLAVAAPKTEEAAEQPPGLSRVVTFCCLVFSGIFLTLLGIMPTDMNSTLTLALLARATATVSFCGRRQVNTFSPGVRGTLNIGVATGEAMVGVGATIAALLLWLGQETKFQLGLIILGSIVTLGASCDIWITGNPLYRRFDYWCGCMKSSVKFSVTSCTREGSAKFNNSSLPYGTLENI